MKVVLVALVSVWGLFVVGAGVTAAPGQSQRPGEMSPPNVWVQNRGAGEAIPVQLVDTGQPLRVQLVRSASGDAEVIPTRAAKQQWEYTQVRIGATQDPVAILNAAGADGWETTGSQLATTGGTLVVLKRPR